MAIYKLGEVAKIQNGRTPSTKNNLLWKKEIPFYGPGDLIDMKIKRFISKDLKMIKRKGTVLFSSTATIGNVGIINQDSWFNQQITSIEANNEIILDKYLFYYMKKISPNIVKKTKGMGTVFPIISINFFKKLEVDIPTLETQKSIIDIIEPLDKQIKLTKKQIKFNKEYENNYFFFLFNYFKKNKKDYKLGDIAKIVGGRGVDNKKNGKKLNNYKNENGKINWLLVKNFNSNKIDGNFEKYDESILENNLIKLEKNELVYSMYATPALSAINENYENLYINQSFCKIIPNSKILDIKYLNFYFDKNRNNFIKLASGTTQKNLNTIIIKNFIINTPPLKLQNSLISIIGV